MNPFIDGCYLPFASLTPLVFVDAEAVRFRESRVVALADALIGLGREFGSSPETRFPIM